MRDIAYDNRIEQQFDPHGVSLWEIYRDDNSREFHRDYHIIHESSKGHIRFKPDKGLDPEELKEEVYGRTFDIPGNRKVTPYADRTVTEFPDHVIMTVDHATETATLRMDPKKPHALKLLDRALDRAKRIDFKNGETHIRMQNTTTSVYLAIPASGGNPVLRSGWSDAIQNKKTSAGEHKSAPPPSDPISGPPAA